MDDEVMGRLMNIAMMRNSSILEFLPPPFEFLECAGMPCLICAPFVPVLWLLSTIIFPSLGPSLSRKFYGGGDCVRGVLPFPRLRVFISRKLF